jgi:uncharacterized protein YcbK (DUF882 family)
MSVPIPRRRFIGLALAATLAPRALAAEDDDGDRRLSFFNTHTSESVDVVYWSRGKYVEPALKAIDTVLRDHRTGEIASMDKDLLDLLFALRSALEARQPFHVISGFRSKQSNEYLRGLSARSGVAKDSQHTKAKAVDVRVPGHDLARVRDAALDLRLGGVGFYPVSGFVHLDVARVRSW